MHSLKTLRAQLLIAAAAAVLLPALPARAQTADQKIQTLQESLDALQAQVADLKRQNADKYADLSNYNINASKLSVANGRPTFTSGDGNFTAAIRALVQYDTGFFSQSKAASTLPAAYGPDLSSGSNFRRAQLGVTGKVFNDFSYYFNYDFGGNAGTETPGHIQQAWVEYNGLAPFNVRIGAFPAPNSFDDATSASDGPFVERAAVSDVSRSIAGGDGRDGIALTFTGTDTYAALTYSGAKVQDGAVFDEQQALVGRFAQSIYSDADSRLVLGANGTYVIKLPDAVANGAATLATTPGGTALNAITLSALPEVSIDSGGFKLANTGALPANHISQWGLEAEGNYQNFYAQGGYYGFNVDRSVQAFNVFTAASTSSVQQVTPSNNNFSGWYLQGTWVLTGEVKAYNTATATYSAPKPAANFSLKDGNWGAFEIGARYSELNLNSHENDPTSVITAWSGANRTYTFYNTVRGGDQKAVAVALNWYPNAALKFSANYEWAQIDRLQTPATVTTSAVGIPAIPVLNGGQTIQAFTLRAQISL